MILTKDTPLAASKFLLNQGNIDGVIDGAVDSVKSLYSVRRSDWENRSHKYLHLIEWAFPLPFMFKRTNGPILTTDDLKHISRSNVGHDYFSTCFWHVFDWISEGSADDWTNAHYADLRRIVASTTLVWDRDRGLEMVENIVSRINHAGEMADVPDAVVADFYTAAGKMRMPAP